MNDQQSPADFVKRNGLFMLAGIVICGIVGSLIAGSDGRALGGGVGAAQGLPVGVLVGKLHYELWVADGDTASQVTDGVTVAGRVKPGTLRSVNGQLTYWGDNGSGGLELWTSDGVAITQVTNVNPTGLFLESPRYGEQLVVSDPVAGDLLFSNGRDVSNRFHLYVSDGTSEGTQQLVAGYANNMSAFNGKLFYAFGSPNNSESWTSDGTVEGTRQFSEYGPYFDLVVAGPIAYYLSIEGNGETRYWKTDGVTVEPSGLPDGVRDLFSAGDTLYFEIPAQDQNLYAVDLDGDVSAPLGPAPENCGGALFD